jgi:hypothetical protein
MGQLARWFRSVHEKLGWMVLAKAKGMHDKVAVYKKSVAHLCESIEHLMSEYTNVNRIHDLKVLHMETKVLMAFLDKHL